ncbi:MAG: diaminopimelate decarboxylase [Escherichia coli]|nr:diaminopimelate decarboxylase [Escherichia coli]
MPHSLFSTDTDLTAENLLRLPAEFGCPVWVYDAQIIRRQIAALKQFDVVRFAQKACSNIHILRLMREQGVKVDSVSLGEIERALAAGYNPQTHPDNIVFTADVIDQATLERVSELQIPVNAGSVDMLDQLGQVSPGHRVWLRVNPGFGHGHSQKTNTGGENSKHGIWYTDLPAALDVIQRHHLQLVGIHMHIGSGVDYAHLEQVCGAMVRQVIEFGQDLQAISAGGGLSIPYQQGEEAVDTEHYYGLWNAAREQIATVETVVAGPLCESGDVFTQQEGGNVETRALPEVKAGDYLVLHDTGAYGASMSSNYNSRPLLPEVLFDNGQARLIRRRQTIEELLALELL